MRKIIHIETTRREQLVDITAQVQETLRVGGVQNGLVSIYAQGATAATMIQEHWDESVQTDVIHLLQKLIPKGVWLHDAQDGNGDAHLKAGLVSPALYIQVVPQRVTRWSYARRALEAMVISIARERNATDGRRAIRPKGALSHGPYLRCGACQWNNHYLRPAPWSDPWARAL